MFRPINVRAAHLDNLNLARIITGTSMTADAIETTILTVAPPLNREYAMDDHTSRLLRWIDVLLRRAAVARQEQSEAKAMADHRSRVLTGIDRIWSRKRQEWLSRRSRRRY